MKRGKVFFVGAGPGDPKLITLRGIEAIQQADVILYDRLAHPSLLQYAKENAEKIYVGKKPDHHTLVQEDINKLIVEKALEGHIVTRLKGGDPTIFGRVGEEALELKRNNITYEIVPGITSAIAVPAYAGIPVTHRDFTSSIAIVTGHENPEKDTSSINWDKLATATGTIIFLMGVANLEKIRDNLIANGRNENTPAAVISWGTRVDQRTVTGTLINIADRVKEEKITSPAIILVGEVVKLKTELEWFEQKPLFGKRVLVTRARHQASELSALIQELGGEAIEFPVIKIVPASNEAFLRAADQLESYDWIIFTSVNGVNEFFSKLKENRIDIRSLAKAKIAAIGPKTAEMLEDKGMLVDVVPNEYRAEALVEWIEKSAKAGERVLMPRADIARKLLADKLIEMGLEVDDLAIYETMMDGENKDEIVELFKERKIHIITFTSSSTVRNFVKSLEGEDIQSLLSGVKLVSIGPITSNTAKELGLHIDKTAKEYTIPGIVQTIEEMEGER